MKTLGLLIERKDISNPTLNLLSQELLFYIFEIDLTLKALEKFHNRKLLFFDSIVGDRKCQTRTSMLIDLFYKNFNDPNQLTNTKLYLLSKKDQLQNFIIKLNGMDSVRSSELIHMLKHSSIADLIKKYNIEISLSKDLIFLALSFATSYISQQEIKALINNTISKAKIDKFQALAKIRLCTLSIEYEQKLATTLKLKNLLRQIVSKCFLSACISMTSFFLSFKIIFEKMKKGNQSFLTKITQFCHCGGIISEIKTLYSLQNKKFQPIAQKNLSQYEVIMVIEGYQFNGSLAKLKSILHVSTSEELIPKEYQKFCICANTITVQNSNITIENTILANFVQHPQFITNDTINWQDLELENSDLKKEFDYLNTIPGCSLDDMSTFLIRHVYASTISDVIQEDQKLPHPLKKNSKYMKK